MPCCECQEPDECRSCHCKVCKDCQPLKRNDCPKMSDPSEKRPPYTADDFRDSNAQRKYREQSQSEQKDDKEVGHIVALEIAAEVLNNYRDPGRISDEEQSTVTKILNDFDNFRMVLKETNRELHVRLDTEIMAKRRSGEALTKDAEGRAKRQVAFIQDHQDMFPKSIYAAFKNFYGGLEIDSGNKVWDERKDKQDKR